MPPGKKPDLQCLHCKKTFKATSSQMMDHINERCLKLENSEKNNDLVYYIAARDAYSSDYWLLIAASGNATLKNLDKLLRDIWLECCGHLSRFTINDDSYYSNPQEDENSMNIKLKSIIYDEDEFAHTYDFGSSTHLSLKVLMIEEGKKLKDVKIELLARNLPPVTKCKNCKEEAAYICTICYETICEKCVKEHECEDGELVLKISNSPRCGVCGYE
jgi:hypothetical protein